jgi:hypothetical protein
MKFLVAAAMMAALIIPATASANNGDQQNCEANPQQHFCSGTVSIDEPTVTECPTGGIVIIVDGTRYPVCNGADGINGVDGAPGGAGPAGPVGPTGANGANGTDGQNGTNGSDGARGEDGSPGSSEGVNPTPAVTVITKIVSPARRPQRCERRFNSHGKLVVVCKRSTCPRREGGKKNRRLVVVCHKPKTHKH